MRQDSLKQYCCPSCGGGRLTVVQEDLREGDEIMEGALECPGCRKRYRVAGGVPRFVPDEHYAGSFGYQWKAHRATQLDSHTGLPLSRDRLFGVSRWPEHLDGQCILEAGSGAGRFTEVLLGTGAEVYSFDLSRAVEANWSNNAPHPHLNLFQGDVLSLPLRPGSFDKVMCLGVIQHTPDPKATFRSLARYVRPGGDLVMDVYSSQLRYLLSWKYLLRPLTVRMNRERLYRLIEKTVPVLLPIAIAARRLGGRAGGRLLPILQYAHWGLPYELNRKWAILDTFDMYSPVHDHPQTLASVRRWFAEEGFEAVEVGNGPNGIVGRGRKAG